MDPAISYWRFIFPCMNLNAKPPCPLLGGLHYVWKTFILFCRYGVGPATMDVPFWKCQHCPKNRMMAFYRSRRTSWMGQYCPTFSYGLFSSVFVFQEAGTVLGSLPFSVYLLLTWGYCLGWLFLIWKESVQRNHEDCQLNCFYFLNFYFLFFNLFIYFFSF